MSGHSSVFDGIPTRFGGLAVAFRLSFRTGEKMTKQTAVALDRISFHLGLRVLFIEEKCS